MSETVTIRGVDGADFFYTLDRVLHGLIAALHAGRLDEAADLYSRIREDIAFQLIARAQGDPTTFRLVANLLFRARDYARAAYCCEQLGEIDKAAALYEKGDDFAAAAQMYASAGNDEKAAEMFEKGGSPIEAGKLYLRIGTPEAVLRAALCFERGDRPFDAAQAYERANRVEKALALYQAVPEDSPDKKVAQKLAAALIERSSLQRAPTGQTPSVAAVPSSAPIAIGGGVLDDDGRNRVTMMEGFAFLKDLPLFAELSLPELKSIYHLCDVVPFPFGARLVEAGRAAPALWVLLEGAVDVRGHGGREIARLGPGAHVGEMGLFDDAPAGVDVIAATPGRALRLDKKGFRDAMAASDSFAVRVYRVLFATLRDRLRATTERLAGSV